MQISPHFHRTAQNAPGHDLDAVARDAAGARRPVHELIGAHDFVMQVATHRAQESGFRTRWRALVEACDSPQKIYQTPEYFTVLQRTIGPGEKVEVFTLLRLSDASILGVLPVLVRERSLPIRFGPLVLGTLRVPMVTLLGSVPAVQGTAAMTEYIAEQLLEHFPMCKAVLMRAMPKGSRCHQHVEQFSGRRLLGSARMGRWRDCNTLHLPSSFEHYLDRFSVVKRHRLNRHIVQLEEQSGALELKRIETVEQVPLLTEAIARLAGSAASAPLLGEVSLACMAEQGMLQSYVLYAEGAPVAAMIGTRSPQVLHIHNILTDKRWRALPASGSAMHLAVRDVIGMQRFSAIDFGYAAPRGDLREALVRQPRASVLLFDRMKTSSALFISYTAS